MMPVHYNAKLPSNRKKNTRYEIRTVFCFIQFVKYMFFESILMQSNEKLGNDMSEFFSNVKNLPVGFQSDFKKFLDTDPVDNSVQGFMKYLSEKE